MRPADQLPGLQAGRLRRRLVEDQESARLQRQGHRRRLPHLYGQTGRHRRRQLGAGSASFPQRSTGTPVWSPSGAFIAFVAEKSNHPGSSVTATPGWGSYSDLWVASADGITRLAAHRRRHRQGPRHDHPGVLSRRAAARMDRAHQGRQGARPESVRRVLGDQGGRLQRRPGRHTGAVQRPDRVADRRRLQRNRRLLSRFVISGVHQRLRNPQLLEQPDLPLRPEFRCNYSTYARQQLQRASPLHPRWPGAVDDQRRQPVTRHRLVDDEPRRLKPTAAQ